MPPSSRPELRLPDAEGAAVRHELRTTPVRPPEPRAVFDREAYSAAHVVSAAWVEHDPWVETPIDWERTLAFREYLWDLGLGVAEAMDTAQRGMGLGWPAARSLIEQTLALASRRRGARVVCGIGTDQLPPKPRHALREIADAYLEQCDFVESRGGQVVMMASRALAASAGGADDYAWVYEQVLMHARRPVVLHWLGSMFDPHLAGYWGARDFESNLETVLGVMRAHAAKVDGIKLSLLDMDKEIMLRRRLPAGVKMFTGDDFNYAELIEGDEYGHSHALLGIFDAIAPAASAALAALAQGRTEQFRDILAPTVPLSRHLFKAPTQFYKTGVVFLAWLNGQQPHFQMLGGMQSARSLPHLVELFRLADRAGVLRDPELACVRMRGLLRINGFDA
ncbi:MAG: dihydrodipicolinate synthase family protein [Burkholderiaceae bacterium]